MKKNKIKFGIAYKLIGMAVLPVMVLGIILTFYGQKTLKRSMKNEINDGLKSAAIAIEGAYDSAGNGDFIQLESGNVIKGTFLVNNNYSLVDHLKKDSDMESSFFFGEQQIVTSLKNDKGERMSDLKVSSDVKKNVLKGGKEYFSENVRIGDKTYFGYYMPVKNEDGSVAGMIFAGRERASVNAILAKEITRMIVISLILIIIAAVVTGFMAISIVRGLKHTVKSLEKVSDGDLSENNTKKTKIRTNDEIGDMLIGIEQLRSSLREVIGSIRKSSESLVKSADGLEEAALSTGKTSKEVEIAVDELSKGAMSQAEDTATAMEHIEKMGGMIEEIVEEIQILVEKSEEMGRTSLDVQNIVVELNKFTKKTTDVVDIISSQTKTTNTSAQEIKKAVELIQTIAEETNLLSLNASIEAARAGEHGRGFAVVADQIQKLAEQSNESAKQIECIITELLDDSQKTVNTMEDMVQVVGSQQDKLKETETGFQRVNTGIRESLEEIENIREQSKQIDDSRKQVMEVISNLSAISEENASVASETAQSANNLNKVVQDTSDEAATLKTLANHLEKQIASFKM